jgi:NADP-dependent 3-hydroxy acid dehydrogenase YdfG
MSKTATAKNKTALVTGATSGIGLETAKTLAAHGWRLVLAGRRAPRLQALQKELAKAHHTQSHLLVLDVRNAAQVEKALNGLPAAFKKIDLLVNNAGLARGLSAFQDGLLSDWDEMIDTNLKGLIYVSRIVSKWMAIRGSGHIINVGSTAGKEAYPNGNVYVATKHAVDALTKAMRMDLVPFGVKVGVIHPGFVETEFSIVRFHGDKTRAKQVYQGFKPLSPKDVAEVITYMAQAPAHINLADVVVMPTAQASATIVHRKP